MKKVTICLLALTLAGCSTEKPRETGHSYITVTNGDEIVSAYRDGEDVTEERKALETQTKEVIGQFLNRDEETLDFERFCMLEEDGMTIEVMVEGVSYTFTCSMEGYIVNMGRTDGERFGIRYPTGGRISCPFVAFISD